MYNCVCMVMVSFLIKYFLIDWCWGEVYFVCKLFDYDLVLNNGGWQWVVGLGIDVVFYFCIFNFISQMDKFDKDWKYIKCWVFEFGIDEYLEFIVEYKMVCECCLEIYKEGLEKGKVEVDG